LQARRDRVHGAAGVVHRELERVQRDVVIKPDRGREVPGHLGLLHHDQIARRGGGAEHLRVEAALFSAGRARDKKR
jgi:hypothetical protein